MAKSNRTRSQKKPSKSVSARKASASSGAGPQGGLRIERVFSDAGCSPFDQVDWDKRSVAITDESGKVVFEQHDVEVPAEWSDLATKVVASKYFYGDLDSQGRENSVRTLIHRVVRTIADWGLEQGYFGGPADAEVF